MSKEQPLVDAAARTRLARELETNLLVEAGAGSGKTHEMAVRMAAGIAAGTYRIDHIVAVTFTRKAAAELRGRFQLALEESLRRTKAPEAAARVQDALANLERFFAGTIHAFCARLLRERPVESGIAPGFTELDDVEERLLRLESWRNYRAQARALGDPDFEALHEAGISTKDLTKALDVMCLYEDVEFPPGDAAIPDGADAWRALEAFWSALNDFLPESIDPGTKCDTQKASLRFADVWRFARRARRTPARLAELLGIWDFTPKVTQYCWSDDAKEKKRIAAAVTVLHRQFRDDVVAPYLERWRQYVYRIVVRVLAHAREEAQRERGRRNALSFNDLLRLTAKVLRENDEVRRALQDKYRWLFVDEFQDTDPLQAEIMLLLSGLTGGGDAARSARPGGAERGLGAPASDAVGGAAGAKPPGSIFVVGDPKQSIYRFRRADIDIYNAVRRQIGGPDEARVLSLTSNFRSVPALCTFANDVFKQVFPAAATREAPAFAPLEPSRKEQSPAKAIYTLTTEADGRDAQRADEASKIASYIRTEVDAGRATFGDFLILTRLKPGLHLYARALEELQIPIEVSGAGAFGESVEVQALARLLQALSDPQDTAALVGVLRGPLFGISDPQLFEYRQAGGWLSVFEGDPGPAPGAAAGAAVRAALQILQRWFRWTRVLPPGGALQRVLEDSGFLALAAASPGGVEAGDLLHAVDRVRSAVEAGFTLAQAADALAAFSGLDDDGPEDSTDVESLPLEPGRPDVVRLMNLHKAKGLEAKVVFLADPLGGRKPTADVRIIRDGHRAIGYFEIKPDWGWGAKPIAAPAEWDQHEADELEFLRAEADRLLYVAVTRAKDRLIVCRSSGKGAQAWEKLTPFLATAPELPVPATVDLPPPVMGDLSAEAMARALRTAEAAREHARRPSWSATSVTAELKRLPRLTPGSDDDVEVDDPTAAVVADTPSRRADTGMAWGTLIHGLLEHAMRHKAATRDDLRRLAMWLTVEEPDLRAVIDQALDTVEAVARAEFWVEARKSPEVYEEAPFAFEDDGRQIVAGTIDMAYRTPDEWRLVDYKTDRSIEPEIELKYTQQLDRYVVAWQRFVSHATAKLVRVRANDFRA